MFGNLQVTGTKEKFKQSDAQAWVYLFADPQDENKIGIDGIQKFCDDLALDPASISILVVAWKFRAATQCEFSKKEFIEGMVDLGWEVLLK